MIKSVHFILTYACNFQCDHCFLYCHPFAKGTFSIRQVRDVLEECRKMESVTNVGFEGGEAFLFYPLLSESIRLASQNGFRTSVQTNGFWATTEEDALLWLKPLQDAGLSCLEESDDRFHHREGGQNNAGHAAAAAETLDMKVNSICIQPPEVEHSGSRTKGEPIYLGGPKLRGRAVETLTKGLPVKPCIEFTQCPYEEFSHPGRVHADPFGNVHLCQGISMGNMWETSFSSVVEAYDPENHPISGPMLAGGPLALARTYNLRHRDAYVDACHMCTEICLELTDRFPQYLAPKQVYGLESS